MNTNKYIVFVGEIFSSHTVHGPFDSQENAKDWVENAEQWAGKQHYEIVKLEEPKYIYKKSK